MAASPAIRTSIVLAAVTACAFGFNAFFLSETQSLPPSEPRIESSPITRLYRPVPTAKEALPSPVTFVSPAPAPLTHRNPVALASPGTLAPPRQPAAPPARTVPKGRPAPRPIHPAPTAAQVPPPPTLVQGTVLHLRDLVVGLVWLEQRTDGLRLTPDQRQHLQPLLPRIRANFEGAPTAFDLALEGETSRLLTADQMGALRRHLEAERSHADCVDALHHLERTCGGAASRDDKTGAHPQ